MYPRRRNPPSPFSGNGEQPDLHGLGKRPGGRGALDSGWCRRLLREGHRLIRNRSRVVPMRSVAARRLNPMAGIFITYRRDDAAGYAGRLHESLERRLGGSQLFRDVDTLQPGQDFVKAIEARLGACQVMVVIIGREWLDARNAAGTDGWTIHSTSCASRSPRASRGPTSLWCLSWSKARRCRRRHSCPRTCRRSHAGTRYRSATRRGMPMSIASPRSSRRSCRRRRRSMASRDD